MRIDAYAHDVPERHYEAIGELHPSTVHRRHTDIGGFFDYDRRIDHLDEHGIDKQVIALGGPHLWRGIDPEAAWPLVKAANDEMRAVADAYPDRYIPVGTLPVIHDGLVDEFDRCINDLEMAGVQLYTNYEGMPIDAEPLHPVYEKAVDEDVPLWLHPQVHDWYDWTDQWGIDLTYGWLFDTTIALARLVFSGLLERYPDLTLITHHGGGMTPHFMARTDLFYPFGRTGVYSYDIFDGAYEELTKPLSEYFSQFYGDTVLYGSVPALRSAYEFYGPDRMIFATDYPYGGDDGRDFMHENLRAMEELDIPDNEKEQIYSGNLLELLGEG